MKKSRKIGFYWGFAFMCKGPQNRLIFCSDRNLKSNLSFLAATRYCIHPILGNSIRLYILLAIVYGRYKVDFIIDCF
jgi:hypothetical protein